HHQQQPARARRRPAYAQQAKQLDDPGVAVYFGLNGKPRVLACDKWLSAAENLAAIAGHIDAMRAQDRYGVGTLDQPFAGHAALRPWGSADWRLVLGFGAGAVVTRDDLDAAFRTKSRAAHPDVGGSHDAQARLSEARMAALKGTRRMTTKPTRRPQKNV